MAPVRVPLRSVAALPAVPVVPAAVAVAVPAAVPAVAVPAVAPAAKAKPGQAWPGKAGCPSRAPVRDFRPAGPSLAEAPAGSH